MVNPQLINEKLKNFFTKFKTNIGNIEEIIGVNIDVKGKIRTLYSVKFFGSGDILKDPDIKKYLDIGGYIIGIEFIGTYQSCKFKFKMSYSNRFSFTRVSKGRNSLELTKRVHSIFEDIFINIYG